MKKFASVFIIISGILWGCMGVFSKELGALGFTMAEGTAIRLITCALIFLAINFKKLKVSIKDLWLFACIGVFSILTMSYTYFESINHSSLTLASILLYTAPVMVTVMSVIFYKESLSLKKILCLCGAVVGIVLISGADKSISLTKTGLIYGLLSGFSYALYSIIGKRLLKTYEPITVSSYAFIFAAVASVFIIDVPHLANTFASSKDTIYTCAVMIGCGLVTAAIPYTLYTLGLKYTPAGKASILACVEPLTASVIGIMFYGDKIGYISSLGIILIISAVIVLSLPDKKHL